MLGPAPGGVRKIFVATFNRNPGVEILSTFILPARRTEAWKLLAGRET